MCVWVSKRPDLLPASLTSEPCRVSCRVLGLLYQGLQLLHVAQQSVGHVLQVEPGVLLTLVHCRPHAAHRAHVQPSHQPS